MLQFTSTIVGVLLVASVAFAQDQPLMHQQQMQMPGQQGGNLLSGLMSSLGGATGQMSRQQNGQQPQGLLGGLGNLGNLGNPLDSIMGGQMGGQLGNGGQMMQGQNGLSNLLQQLQHLPQRGMQMLNQLVASIRQMMPQNGFGRNGNNMQQQQQFPGQQGLNMQGLTAPLNDLTQGRLPDISQLSQQLPNMANNLVPGLGNSLSNVLPQQQQQQQQQRQQQLQPQQSQPQQQQRVNNN